MVVIETESSSRPIHTMNSKYCDCVCNCYIRSTIKFILLRLEVVEAMVRCYTVGSVYLHTIADVTG